MTSTSTPHQSHDERYRWHAVRTRADLLRAGWTDGRIRHAVMTGTLHTVFAGTYATVDPTTDPFVVMTALRKHYGDHVVAVLDSAALLHRLPQPWPPDPTIHARVAPGSEVDAHKLVTFHAWQLAPTETVTVAGIGVTTLRRTLVDLMCTTDRLSAVSALDAALRRRAVSPNDLRELQRATRRRRGSARSRPWWLEADARSESPLETRVRLRAVDGGYPPDELQKRFDVGSATYFADMAWKQPSGRWLIAEADGAEFHDTPTAVFHDRTRANELVGQGDVDLVRFTWADSASPWPVPRTLSRLLGPPR